MFLQSFYWMEGVIEAPCLVCGATTRTGLHYGAITCYPCRAFFRLLALAFDWCFLSSFKRSRVNHPSICSTTTRTLKIAFFTLPRQSFEKTVMTQNRKVRTSRGSFPKKEGWKALTIYGNTAWIPSESGWNIYNNVLLLCFYVNLFFSWMPVWFCVCL